jgi:hypothetical protein
MEYLESGPDAGGEKKLPKAGNVQVLNGVSGLLDAGFDLHTTCIK